MKKRFSLRSQIFLIITVSMFLIIGFIYLFQTAFLENFYKIQKIETISNIGNLIAEHLDEKNLPDKLEQMQLNNEVCVRVISGKSDVTGNACALNRLDKAQIASIYMETLASGGEKLFSNYRFIVAMGEPRDLYIYAKTTTYGSEEILILVSSLVSPLGATVETLKSQYPFVASIVVVMILLMALIISKMIITPIKKIEEEATALPLGQYDGREVKSSIAELSSLNDTLVQANEQINKAALAKKELIANVSHDLRTPLTMISGYGELIRDFPEEQNKENIEVIINEANRLSRLVDDLLDLGKLDGQNVQMQLQPIEVAELITTVYRQYEEFCSQNQIEFSKQIEASGSFRGDYGRLQQVLYNFMANAINYNNKKERKIVIGSRLLDNGRICIYVYDNGPGIKEEDKELIFERYYKVDKEHKRASLGSGIGLAICKEVLVAHGFKFGVDSKLDEYSVFYFEVESIS